MYCVVLCWVVCFFLQIKLTVSLCPRTPQSDFFVLFVFLLFECVCVRFKALLFVYNCFMYRALLCSNLLIEMCFGSRSKRITHNNRTYLYEVPTLVWLQSECKLQTLMYKLVNDTVDIEMLPTFHGSIVLKYSFWFSVQKIW